MFYSATWCRHRTASPQRLSYRLGTKRTIMSSGGREQRELSWALGAESKETLHELRGIEQRELSWALGAEIKENFHELWCREQRELSWALGAESKENFHELQGREQIELSWAPGTLSWIHYRVPFGAIHTYRKVRSSHKRSGSAALHSYNDKTKHLFSSVGGYS